MVENSRWRTIAELELPSPREGWEWNWRCWAPSTWTMALVMGVNKPKAEELSWRMNVEAGLGMEAGLYVEVALSALCRGCEWN